MFLARESSSIGVEEGWNAVIVDKEMQAMRARQATAGRAPWSWHWQLNMSWESSRSTTPFCYSKKQSDNCSDKIHRLHPPVHAEVLLFPPVDLPSLVDYCWLARMGQCRCHLLREETSCEHPSKEECLDPIVNSMLQLIKMSSSGKEPLRPSDEADWAICSHHHFICVSGGKGTISVPRVGWLAAQYSNPQILKDRHRPTPAFFPSPCLARR